MPCLCGNKVERLHPKIQCAKCNDLFHLKCVNIVPSDVEFLTNSGRSFHCNTCAVARRNSIRSPPPSTILEESVTFVCDRVENLNEQSQLALLKTVINEIAALREENVRVVALVNVLHDDNQRLICKTEYLQSELQSLKAALRFDELASAMTMLSAEVKDVRLDLRASINNSRVACMKPLPITHTAVPAASTPLTYSAAVTTGANGVNGSSAVGAAVHNTPVTSARSVSLPITVNTKKSGAKLSAATTTDAIAAVNAATVPAAQLPVQVQWATIENRRNKKQKKARAVVVGSNTSNELDVIATKKWMHISSFKPTVSEDSIISYVEKNSGIDREQIACFKLVKKDADTNTLKKINFKVGVPPSLFDSVLKPTLWPANVKVRPFKFFPRDEPHNQKT